MSELHHIIVSISDILHKIWHYDLVIVSGNHIKVSNLTLSIILLLAGIKYSKNVANLVKNYLHAKIQHDKDAINALEKLAVYAALILFIITILEIANVPLSSFAFIGGALAIGVGFGAQTLIGNFISSLIIMLERPVKIGDIVEIEGVTGTITSIGARCVIITTFSNVEVLVPNSKLMIHTLVNWTLSDKTVKHQIELTIPRKHKIEFNPEYFMEQLQYIMRDLEFIPDDYEKNIYFTRIDVDSFTFLINCYCDVEKTHNPEYVKNILNIALFKQLKDYDFTMKYLSVVEIKPVADALEKES